MKLNTIKKASTAQLESAMNRNDLDPSGLDRSEMQAALVTFFHGKKDAFTTKVESLAAVFTPVQFNFEYDAETGFSVDGHKVTIGRSGFTYLTHYFLRNFINEDRAQEEFYNKEYASFAVRIRNARDAQIESDNRKGRRADFVMSTINDSLMAIMTNYTPFSNLQVLKAVEDAGLKVHRASVNTSEMILDLTTDLASENFSWHIRIENGETGLRALRFGFSVSIDDYVHSFPVYSKARHLSTIGDIVTTLEEILEEAKGLEIEAHLETKSTLWVVQQAPDKVKNHTKWDSIHMAIINEHSAINAINALIDLRDEFGFRGITGKMLDAVLNAAAKL